MRELRQSTASIDLLTPWRAASVAPAVAVGAAIRAAFGGDAR